jgi:hypothetical protein
MAGPLPPNPLSPTIDGAHTQLLLQKENQQVEV